MATLGRTQRSSHLALPKSLFRVPVGDLGLIRGPGEWGWGGEGA